MATQLTQPDSLNTSGVVPLDLRVLVKPDAAQDRIGSIILAPETKDQQAMAMTKATLIAVGENAWEEAAARSGGFVKPAPGDRVMIAKYGGVELKGLDGEKYRLLNDEDVVGRLEE